MIRRLLAPAILGMMALYLAACAGATTSADQQDREIEPPKKDAAAPKMEPEPAKPTCASLEPGDHDLTIGVGETTRDYRLHVPSPRPEGPAPLVIVLHGGGQKGGAAIQGPARVDPVADKNGFLVGYPTGTRGLAGGYTWNGGDCCGAAMRKRMDDVNFVSNLIDELVGGGCVDRKRVYATGISNGAIFTYRLACELSGKIAAIAPIAGALMLKKCKPRRPVPAIIFHGTADRDVPLKGGFNIQSGARRRFPPFQHTLQTWLDINRCPAESHTVYDKGEATCVGYEGCGRGGAVTVCKIQGGGHTWPGGEAIMTKRLGRTTQDISASAEMWRFFAAHPMR
jgi:polyhydroxybutyrate depolymerase